MSLPYESATNAFQTARVTSGTYIEYPFTYEGDTTTKIYHIICEVYDTSYQPISLDTTLADGAGFTGLPAGYANSAAYHIGDFNKQKIDGGLVRFDRQFATIPATRSNVLTGTIAYTYPGIAASTDGGVTSSITAISGNTITASTSASAGDSIYYNISTTGGGITLVTSGFATALAGTSSSQIVTSGFSSIGTFSSGNVTVLASNIRAPLNAAAGSFTTYTYSIPDNFYDVAPSEIFTPSESTLNSGTIPTASAYQALIDDNTETGFILISSEITKYAGNIVQKADVKVKAI
jgi:hypothetical protein